jgi:spore maturation protein CgeB
MRIIMFYHSLLSDWNHGNAHFLRGIATDLFMRGHDVRIYEPRHAWSLQHLIAEQGAEPIRRFHAIYPWLTSWQYDLEMLDLNQALDAADMVLVHEWNEPALVQRIGKHRACVGGYRLLFHDTHHRSVSDPANMEAYDLRHYDGVLAFGEVIRDLYLTHGWARHVWTWHEAADTRIFRPIEGLDPQGDVVWIGNWGDDERTAELSEFVFNPVKALGLKACVYGVQYPAWTRAILANASITYGGWLPNYEVPRVFARFKVTVHVPRRPYVRLLPGIPTIRPFEALACGIPLLCSPWNDTESLFTPGKDFLVARNGAEMQSFLKALLQDEAMAHELAGHGRQTILRRHTCAHRVDELLAIYAELEGARLQAGETKCAAD